jgi:hypothetical protein
MFSSLGTRTLLLILLLIETLKKALFLITLCTSHGPARPEKIHWANHSDHHAHLPGHRIGPRVRIAVFLLQQKFIIGHNLWHSLNWCTVQYNWAP